VDGLSMNLSMNLQQRAPRMPRMPLRRRTLPGRDKHAQGITDLRIKRLGVRIPPDAPSVYRTDNAFSEVLT
jgi:hypothetical protein